MFMYSYCYVWSALCIMFHCVVLCTVCVQMCAVKLTPGFNPITVSRYICLSKVINRARSSYSSFKFQYPLFPLTSSSSCLRLIPRLRVPSNFPSITYFRSICILVVFLLLGWFPGAYIFCTDISGHCFNRVFRNVGTEASDTRESPKRNSTTFTTRGKFEIKNVFMFVSINLILLIGVIL